MNTELKVKIKAILSDWVDLSLQIPLNQIAREEIESEKTRLRKITEEVIDEIDGRVIHHPF